MNTKLLGLSTLLVMSSIACKSTQPPSGPTTFGDDLAFLQKHADTIVLSDAKGEAQVAIVPAFQARVMTSTSGGASGLSHGYLHRERIASKTPTPHINVFGGEDRFWIGPEGGQFSVFFAPGARFELADWHTPAPIDSEAFDVVETAADHAIFRKRMGLTNWSGTTFDLEVTREVRLRDPSQVLATMRVELPAGVRGVAFESLNSVVNLGKTAWKKDTGLLSIWILGMFPASPAATVVVPFQTGTESIRGPIVNDEYFGKIPADRLRVKHDEGLLLFRADARHRSKLGVGPKRAHDVLGSWDAKSGVLTIVQYSLPKPPGEYVNSLWKHQDDPYGGDVVNSYNDGPSTPGRAGFGNFYELETSSPALALRPGERANHAHRTLHLSGDQAGLERIAKSVLGVHLGELASVAKP
ncbi:MAG: hypothetical protein IPJ77_04180 [Planctomycetes bacterium]|nr:hypothetical protein [Planctomycetota bacterium]